MSMHFIYGGSGSGKTELLCSRIIEESLKHPEKQYLVIVPEQATLQTQLLYVERHPNKGLMNIDVLSFQRLAYRVQEELGEDTRIVLRDTGKNLLLRKAAGDISEELRVFAGNFRRIGYVSEMKSLLSELAQYRIDQEKLKSILELCPAQGSLRSKLEDIAILQKRFTELLGETYVTGEELLEQLAHNASGSALLRGAVLAFDGFTGFTPVQEALLEELFRLASDLYFTAELSHDAAFDRDEGTYGLFHLSQEMLMALRRIARETHTPIEEPAVQLPERGLRFREAPELEHLERNLFRRTGNTGPYMCEEGAAHSIQVHVVRNPMEEAQYLACAICRMIREKGCRYRDIAVTVSSMDVYRDCITAAFEEYEIPFFMDQKRNALNNAAVEYLRAAVAMVAERLSYESVFRFLKSGFYPISAEDLYLMENYVLALDVKGFRRYEERWIRRPATMTVEEVLRADELRAVFLEQTGEFLTAMRRRDRTVRSCTEALYHLLEQQRIPEQLQEKETIFEEHGQAALGREYAQIYRLLIDMFDEFVSLLGEEPVALREYRELLDAGLAELRIGVIPPGRDQVLIGDLERSRISGVQYLFCAGLNDVHLPGIKETKGILNDREREYLASRQVKLAPTQLEKIATQRFYLYLSLTKPSRGLYLSYSRVDMEGKTMQPSFYLREITGLYDAIPVQEAGALTEKEELPYSESRALRYLAEGLRNGRGPEDPDWMQLFSWYRVREEGARKIRKLVEARFLKNPKEKLSAQRAREIYGTMLETSITRLEKYADCPYAHFLQYGLSLKEREEFRFELVDEGSVMHEALYRLGNLLKKKGYSWNEAPEEVLRECCQQAMEEAAAGYGNAILNSTARRQYHINRMTEKLELTAGVLQKQLQMGGFTPAEYELRFGSTSIAALPIRLDEESVLSLRGQIDRLDTAERDGSTYIKVLDYKNGDKSMDLSAVYHGLDLQLFLYLKVAETYIQKEHPEQKIHPAGVLYYHVLNPVFDRNGKELGGKSDREALENAILKSLKPEGMVNADSETLELFDREFYTRETGESQAIPVKLNKDGSFSKYSRVLTEEEFGRMEQHLLGVIRRQGQEILSGEIPVAPVQHGSKQGCEYCKFRQICGFDTNVPGYEERKLETLDTETVLLRLHAQEVEE